MIPDPQSERPTPGSWLLVALAWTAVSVPLLWGVWVTLTKSAMLFQ